MSEYIFLNPALYAVMYYVYVLKWNNSGDLYIGYTNDIEQRVKQHNRKNGCTLLYFEAYTSEKLARGIERKLKHYGSAWRALKKRIVALLEGGGRGAQYCS